MHEIVWYGLDKIYDEDWAKTEQYQNLSIRFCILPKIIEKLQSDGYKIVPVSEIIYTDNYGIDQSGKQYQLSNQ